MAGLDREVVVDVDVCCAQILTFQIQTSLQCHVQNETHLLHWHVTPHQVITCSAPKSSNFGTDQRQGTCDEELQRKSKITKCSPVYSSSETSCFTYPRGAVLTVRLSNAQTKTDKSILSGGEDLSAHPFGGVKCWVLLSKYTPEFLLSLSSCWAAALDKARTNNTWRGSHKICIDTQSADSI